MDPIPSSTPSLIERATSQLNPELKKETTPKPTIDQDILSNDKVDVDITPTTKGNIIYIAFCSCILKLR